VLYRKDKLLAWAEEQEIASTSEPDPTRERAAGARAASALASSTKPLAKKRARASSRIR